MDKYYFLTDASGPNVKRNEKKYMLLGEMEGNLLNKKIYAPYFIIANKVIDCFIDILTGDTIYEYQIEKY